MPSSRSNIVLSTGIALAALSGCSTTTSNPNLPVGDAAYQVVPAAIPAPTAYQIQPADTLDIKVFGEPDLSSDKLRVDDAGNIQLPLVGSLQAAGASPAELTGALATKLRERYLVNPQVAVSVVETAPHYASVEGEVQKPGVYEITPGTTLLGAVARAESPTPTARLDEVVIFRTIDNQRMAARFNLKDIRGGVSPDPIILNGDVVMVGHSAMKGLWQDVLKTAPFFNAFAVLSRN